jgi:DNA-binding NarL/FixJ family response regulator
VAIQEFDFASGKVLDPNRRQAIILSTSVDDANTLSEELRKQHYKLLGTLDDIRAVLELIGKHKIGVLFMDDDVVGTKSLDILASVLKAYPEFKVVLMTSSPTKELLLEAQQAGAAGFLAKPLAAEAVDKVISRIK